MVPNTPFIGFITVALPLCIVLAVVTAIVFIDLRAVNVIRRVVRSVRCPLHEQTLTVELAEELCGGGRVDLLRCGAFHPGHAVQCEKACVQPRRRPSARMQPEGS